MRSCRGKAVCSRTLCAAVRAPRVELEMSRIKTLSLCVLWSLSFTSAASIAFSQVRDAPSAAWRLGVGQEWPLKPGAGAPARVVRG